jgi:hypothetical protein
MSLMQQQQMAGRNPLDVDSDAILAHLTSRQHLHPHAPVAQILEQTTELFGCCPAAIERGIDWLGIEPARPIGRLRRSELVQLARAVHRFWMQNVNSASAGS